MCAAALAVGSTAAMAQGTTFEPEEGATYTIHCPNSGGHYICYTIGDDDVHCKGQGDGLECYFTITDAGEGAFRISPITAPTQYMHYSSTESATANLGWATDATGNDTQWVIAPGQTEGQYTISPFDKTDTYLNCWGGNGATLIGLYTGSTDPNSQFIIEKVEVSLEYDAELVSEVEANLAKTGVGYPVAESDVRTALQSALNGYKANQSNLTLEIVNALTSAYNAYLLSETVQLPEDGKVYTFTFVVSNNGNVSERYLNFNSNDGSIESVSRETGMSAADLPLTARFIARHIDGDRYMFVNAAAGQYLVWKGNGNNDAQKGKNENKGVMESYEETWAALTLGTMASASANFGTGSLTQATAENVFGLMTLYSRRNDATSGNNVYSYLINRDNGNFDAANDPYFNGTFSTGIRIEEAPAYLNTVNLQQPVGDSYAYSTVYLPFAVDVPQGVEAFTGSLSEGEGGTTLRLTGIGDGVIPARTAAVLRGTTDGSLALVPATATGTAVEANALQGTLDASATTPANTYALSGAFAEGIGFYPYTATTLPAGKAYLTLTDAQAVQKLAFSFGQGTTGIDAIEAGAADKAATWYDLSGRRVDNPTKGVYIVNGKKVIVK